MDKGKLSIIIPSRGEQFMPQTVNDIFAKAKGSIEVTVILDGAWPVAFPKDRPNLVYIHLGEAQGMRPAINSGASISHGEFLLKCDGHCLFAEGFDEVLRSEVEDNWIVVPRRYSLDPVTWTRNEDKAPVDAHYLSYPIAQDQTIYGLHGEVWRERAKQRADVLFDDEMSSQGSAWFMTRKHWDWLCGLHTEGYGTFIQEFQELGMKTWLGGGQVKVNKKTWYAHLHKGTRFPRGYPLSRSERDQGIRYSADFWMNNRWTGRVHDMSWLISKFAPVPSWPDNWEELFQLLPDESGGLVPGTTE